MSSYSNWCLRITLGLYLFMRRSPLWHGVKSGVFVKDALAILNEEAVGVQAMNAYLEILSYKPPEQGDPESLFMSTFDWGILGICDLIYSLG
ncbi:hypothetical protein RchiOBHm_Chr5g0012151 [Rosa chinensis]|uniref:Uncharacterized protein n=1 Tax=Rosa chinensis TaxID=74649 RepID=A0A2P6Q515_ROSCH|nr:hypothetical protein RchiOBHm_Chr5g0012151 [Rosa chinensis]